MRLYFEIGLKSNPIIKFRATQIDEQMILCKKKKKKKLSVVRRFDVRGTLHKNCKNI